MTMCGVADTLSIFLSQTQNPTTGGAHLVAAARRTGAGSHTVSPQPSPPSMRHELPRRSSHQQVQSRAHVGPVGLAAGSGSAQRTGKLLPRGCLTNHSLYTMIHTIRSMNPSCTPGDCGARTVVSAWAYVHLRVSFIAVC